MSRSLRRLRRKPADGALHCGLRAALGGVLLLLGGCQWGTYYGQAILGQVEILTHQKPLVHLISAPQTPEALREKLSLILTIRRFAETGLDLPVGRNYKDYVDLGRPQAVYCVFAAPEFSLRAKTWCYPFVGCAAYRGYFSERKARDYARDLRHQGYDVAIGGAAAYSTLGWFADPVLNTIIDRNPEELAGLIFHELAHHIFYVADDTTFNESFATTVEREGVRRWLEAGNPGDMARYRTTWDRQADVLKLLAGYRRRLEDLYAGLQPEAFKRRQKAEIFDALQNDYRALLTGWGDNGSANSWLQQPLNNAHLVSVGSYHDLVPAFQRLLNACHTDFAVFYRVCKRLAKLPQAQRRVLLATPDKLLEPTS
jgi:predicted aminopeptidase